MPTDMQHERHRWSYMSEADLLRRLGRITKPEKLINFLRLAEEHRTPRLTSACLARMSSLGYSDLAARESRDLRTTTGVQNWLEVRRAEARNPESNPMKRKRGPKPAAKPKPKKPAIRKIRFLKAG